MPNCSNRVFHFDRRTGTERMLDLAIGPAFPQRQNQSCAKHVSSRQTSRLRPTLQLLALHGGDRKQSLIIGHIIHMDAPIIL
jgi:hypothetical protein